MDGDEADDDDVQIAFIDSDSSDDEDLRAGREELRARRESESDGPAPPDAAPGAPAAPAPDAESSSDSEPEFEEVEPVVLPAADDEPPARPPAPTAPANVGDLSLFEARAALDAAMAWAADTKALGNDAFRSGALENALGWYGEARASLGGWADFAAELAAYDAAGGRASGARQVAELRVDLCMNTAACHLKQRRFAEVLRHCGDALALDPACVKARYRRGLALAALGRCDEAEKALAEACALDGANREIARKLAEVRRANKLRRSGGLFGAAGDYAAEEQRRAAERRGAILGACVARARLVLAAAGTAEDARSVAAQDAARAAVAGAKAGDARADRDRELLGGLLDRALRVERTPATVAAGTVASDVVETLDGVLAEQLPFSPTPAEAAVLERCGVRVSYDDEATYGAMSDEAYREARMVELSDRMERAGLSDDEATELAALRDAWVADARAARDRGELDGDELRQLAAMEAAADEARHAPAPADEDARRAARVDALLATKRASRLAAKERVELRRLVAAEIEKLERDEADFGLSAAGAGRLGRLREEQEKDAVDKAKARAARRRSEEAW